MKVLSNTRSKWNPIYVQLLEYEGRRLFDIRRFFWDKKNNEYKPTQKGISLNADNFKQVLEIIHANIEDIGGWLGIRIHNNNVSASIEAQGYDEERARNEANARGKDVETYNISDPRDLFPYRCKAEGGRDHLYENCAHPLIESMTKSARSAHSDADVAEQRGIMQDVFHSYFVAMDRIQATSRDGVFDREQFEFEWDRILRSKLKKRNRCVGEEYVRRA